MGPTAIAPSSHILARDGLGLSFGVTEEGPEAETDRGDWSRSEEHTSELQSRLHLVCRLLREKKKLPTDKRVLAK